MYIGNWNHLLKEWIREDCPHFDVAGNIVGNGTREAIITSKSEGVLCGQPFANEIFRHFDCEVVWRVDEGARFSYGCALATIKGPLCGILRGERLSLNLLSRASAIATKRVRQIVPLEIVVAATRKTTPGFRFVEKYAVRIGGCDAHRCDLSSCVMFKDNHLKSGKSIEDLVHSVQSFTSKIEVECSTDEMAYEAVKSGADIIMLDNYSSERLGVVQQLKEINPRILVEVSGGITPEVVQEYCVEGVDVLSMSCLTSADPIDLSLNVV